MFNAIFDRNNSKPIFKGHGLNGCTIISSWIIDNCCTNDYFFFPVYFIELNDCEITENTTINIYVINIFYLLKIYN